MYDIPYGAENEYLTPPESEIAGYCCECGEDIFEGEDIWQIKDELYCERCIGSSKTEFYKENFYHEMVC